MSGHDVATEPRLDRRGAALRAARSAASIRPRLRVLSNYCEQVRHSYAAFESDMRAGASEVYVHGMPGGAVHEPARAGASLGIDDTRWHEVARAYSQVNEMFGDIVKVTPSSKVVGDMALLMVTSGLDAARGGRSGRRGRVSGVRRLAASAATSVSRTAASRRRCSSKVLKGAVASAGRGRARRCRPVDLTKCARASCRHGCRARSPITTSHHG